MLHKCKVFTLFKVKNDSTQWGTDEVRVVLLVVPVLALSFHVLILCRDDAGPVSAEEPAMKRPPFYVRVSF